MNIKNYRKVKAVQQDPGVTLRWLISELEDAPNVAMKLYELAPATIGPVHTHAWEDEIFVLRGNGAVVGPEALIDRGHAAGGARYQRTDIGNRLSSQRTGQDPGRVASRISRRAAVQLHPR